MNNDVHRDRDWGQEAPQREHNAGSWDKENQPILDLSLSIESHWKAIQSPKRLKILAAVGELGTCTSAELAEYLESKTRSVNYHLRCLEEVGLLFESAQKQKTGKRMAAVYSSRLQDNTVCLQVDPTSELEMFRLQKIRSLWANATVETFKLNFDKGVKSTSGERFIRYNEWLRVTPEQKDKIESLYEQLIEVIGEVHASPTLPEEGNYDMQYAFWMISDYIHFGPIPTLRFIRKR